MGTEGGEYAFSAILNLRKGKKRVCDEIILSGIRVYVESRKNLIKLGERWPDRIGGNDNLIGRIGEFVALRFLESLGQQPKKVPNPSNKGYDFVDGHRKTQVKVISAENLSGRTVRLKKPWNQFVLIELDESYGPMRIGLLTSSEHSRALSEDSRRSETPIVARTMLNERGLIGRYGQVFAPPD